MTKREIKTEDEHLQDTKSKVKVLDQQQANKNKHSSKSQNRVHVMNVQQSKYSLRNFVSKAQQPTNHDQQFKIAAPITNFRMPTPTSLETNSFFTPPVNDLTNQMMSAKIKEQTKLPEIKLNHTNLAHAHKQRTSIKHQYVSSESQNQLKSGGLISS